jgi:hypothetical protein
MSHPNAALAPRGRRRLAHVVVTEHDPIDDALVPARECLEAWRSEVPADDSGTAWNSSTSRARRLGVAAGVRRTL